MASHSQMSDEFAISPENQATVDAATLRLVNQVVEQRARLAAQAEDERALLEKRVWRWALVGFLALVLLAGAFATLSGMHLL